MGRRTIEYKLPMINARGDIYATQTKIGSFVGYADDYKSAVVEDDLGQIHRIPVTDIRFVDKPFTVFQ